MILLHRITPFFIGLCTALGFAAILVLHVYPLIAMLVTIVVVALLLTRLIGFAPRQFQYWMLLGTPLLFLISSDGLLLFLERPLAQISLAVTVSLFIFFFAEHTFSYIHAPVNYEAYAIEYLSLVLNVASVFFVSVTAFGTRVFLPMFAPIPALTVLFFLISLFVMYGTLWASKVDIKQARLYALCGALLVTELFITVTYLPTGFYTNAALIALTVYVFVGLTRAHFLENLTPTVFRRYAVTAIILLICIVGSAKWL